MAVVTVAIAQAIKNIPKSIMEQDLMWWLKGMAIARDNHQEDFYAYLAEYPCYCEQLEDQTDCCASCYAQVIVNRRLFATREIGHESSNV
jgi:hypothetical protein